MNRILPVGKKMPEIRQFWAHAFDMLFIHFVNMYIEPQPVSMDVAGMNLVLTFTNEQVILYVYNLYNSRQVGNA